jgi:hypothetical protein
MSTHMSKCCVCGKQTACCNDTHALGCGSACHERGPKIEFCSLECFYDLKHRMEERLIIYFENQENPDGR